MEKAASLLFFLFAYFSFFPSLVGGASAAVHGMHVWLGKVIV
jgi:hypothetical protein